MASNQNRAYDFCTKNGKTTIVKTKTSCGRKFSVLYLKDTVQFVNLSYHNLSQHAFSGPRHTQHFHTQYFDKKIF